MGHCFCDTLLDFCDPDPAKVAKEALPLFDTVLIGFETIDWQMHLIHFKQTTHCLEELEVLLRQEVRRKLGREVDSLEDLSDIDIESR